MDTTTHKYGVDLTQNLFRWENWVALKRADAQVAQAEADYQAAQQDLIARVAQRYFDVLAAQDDLDAQRGQSRIGQPPARAGREALPSRPDRRHRRGGGSRRPRQRRRRRDRLEAAARLGAGVAA